MSMVEFAVATAAAVLLCANLSLNLANQTDYGLGRGVYGERHDATALEEITRRLPDTPPGEAFHRALPLRGSYASPAGDALFMGSLHVWATS